MAPFYSFMKEAIQAWIDDFRSVCPVSAKTALVIAGATGGTAASPMPLGSAPLSIRACRSSEVADRCRVALHDAAAFDGDPRVKGLSQTA